MRFQRACQGLYFDRLFRLNEPELTELLVGESVISRDLTSCWLSCGARE